MRVNFLFEQYKAYLNFHLVSALIATGILCAAFVMDRIFEAAPCVLCIYQRYPYGLTVVLGLLGWKLPRIAKVCTFAILGCIVAEIGIATYHTGVEHAWWDASGSCKAELDFSKQITSVDAFRKMIDDIPIADCRKPAMKILDLSLAEWNVLMNLGFLAAFIAFRKQILRQSRCADDVHTP